MMYIPILYHLNGIYISIVLKARKSFNVFKERVDFLLREQLKVNARKII